MLELLGSLDFFAVIIFKKLVSFFKKKKKKHLANNLMKKSDKILLAWNPKMLFIYLVYPLTLNKCEPYLFVSL